MQVETHTGAKQISELLICGLRYFNSSVLRSFPNLVYVEHSKWFTHLILIKLEVEAIKFLYFLGSVADLERAISKVHKKKKNVICTRGQTLRRLTHADRVAPMISEHLTNCLDDKAAANGE